MRWSWRPWRRHVDRTAEAKERLDDLTRRDAAVERLAEQLREAQRRNHFSEMVYVAIAQHRGTA